MNEGPVFDNFRLPDLELSMMEVLRLLGAGRDRPVRASVRQLLAEELDVAADLIAAKAMFRMCAEGVPGSSYLNDARGWVVAVCTIGPELETRATGLSSSGQLARAVVSEPQP